MGVSGDMHESQADLDRQVRHRIYRQLAAVARAPGAAELAADLDRSVAAIQESLRRLATAHALALAPGTDDVWMAHPFSAVSTPFPVRTAERTYWANCAWDALGIAALLAADSETTTECADCGEPMTLRVRGDVAEPGDAVVHFLVPPARFWDDIGFT